jgi:hypothetical protein
MNRFTEASSLAGIGLIVNALPALIASKGTDTQAWGSLLGGVFGLFAIFRREGSRAVA